MDGHVWCKKWVLKGEGMRVEMDGGHVNGCWKIWDMISEMSSGI